MEIAEDNSVTYDELFRFRKTDESERVSGLIETNLGLIKKNNELTKEVRRLKTQLRDIEDERKDAKKLNEGDKLSLTILFILCLAVMLPFATMVIHVLLGL